jgi:hypothetical protein
MRYQRLLIVLAAVVAAALAQPEDSSWVSYYNGVDGWFEFQGPERAMLIDPADFGLTCPVQVESLKIWFYWGMGSRTDTVFTFKLYAGDGATLLWQSESLTAPVTNWVYYGLAAPVQIDSGRFYIVATARTVNPYAHPYINIDDDTIPDHCFFGHPGAWTQCSYGNYCFFAFIREVQVGVAEGRWTRTPRRPPHPSIVRGIINLQSPVCNLQSEVVLLDACGRKVMDLRPGENDVRHLAPGVYLVRVGSDLSRVVLAR